MTRADATAELSLRWRHEFLRVSAQDYNAFLTVFATSVGTTCAVPTEETLVMSHARRSTAETAAQCQPLWTAARGAQVINCELIVPSHGPAIIRCGYGPESIIRSQCIVSSEAAAVVAETWKMALLAQGFRLGS
ncbi:MAG TPA: hypothetical protein VFD69_18010 [Vicinamibacterales bacterium]|nr:hypothetical protein [Vicinamibacterales bacterium]